MKYRVAMSYDEYARDLPVSTIIGSWPIHYTNERSVENG